MRISDWSSDVCSSDLWNRYEQLYQQTPIDAVATAHTPITMRLDDGTHLSFHEAALVDYAGMWFKRVEGQKFRATLSASPTVQRVVRDLLFPTPRRPIRIAQDPSGVGVNHAAPTLQYTNKPAHLTKQQATDAEKAE